MDNTTLMIFVEGFLLGRDKIMFSEKYFCSYPSSLVLIWLATKTIV